MYHASSVKVQNILLKPCSICRIGPIVLTLHQPAVNTELLEWGDQRTTAIGITGECGTITYARKSLRDDLRPAFRLPKTFRYTFLKDFYIDV